MFICRMEMIMGRIGELGDRLIEFTQPELQRERRLEQKMNRVSGTCAQ